MRWTLIAAAALLAACGGDPAEPAPPPFQLVLSDSVRELVATPDSVNCRYSLFAEATGGATGDFARWLNSELQWVDPASGQRYDEDLTAVDLLDYFGADRVLTGERLESRRVAWWDRPFQVHYTIRHEGPDGAIKSEDVWVDCRP